MCFFAESRSLHGTSVTLCDRHQRKDDITLRHTADAMAAAAAAGGTCYLPARLR